MLKKLLTGCFVLFLVIFSVNTCAIAKNITDFGDKVFPKSDKVNTEKVKFKNRFGIELAGDLYYPKTMKKDEKLPAIAISGPFGAVKEQSSGLYAQTLAEKGFITLAFDPSYTGESSGPCLPQSHSD